MPLPLSMTAPTTQSTQSVHKAHAPGVRHGFQPIAPQVNHSGFAGNTPSGQRPFSLFGPEGFDANDLIDIINPLQHLPIISMVYRSISGDEISPGARLIGSTIMGGPIGFATSMVDLGVRGATGKGMKDHVVAMARDAIPPSMMPDQPVFPNLAGKAGSARPDPEPAAAQESVDTTIAYFGQRPAFVGPASAAAANQLATPSMSGPATNGTAERFRSAWNGQENLAVAATGHRPPALGTTLVIDSASAAEAPSHHLVRRYAPPPRWS